MLQSDLAKTFEMIADQGPAAFYTGDIAGAIIKTQRAIRTDGGSGIDAGIGRMTLADLAGYDVVIREPVVDNYRGFPKLAPMAALSGRPVFRRQ